MIKIPAKYESLMPSKMRTYPDKTGVVRGKELKMRGRGKKPELKRITSVGEISEMRGITARRKPTPIAPIEKPRYPRPTPPGTAEKAKRQKVRTKPTKAEAMRTMYKAKTKIAPLTTMQKAAAKAKPMSHMKRARRLKEKTSRLA